MNLNDIVKANSFLSEKTEIKDDSSTFQSTLENRLKIFNLSIKDFKIKNKYDFSQETAGILVCIHDFNLKQYANNFRKDNLQKIDVEDFTHLARLVEKLVKSHFKEEKPLKDALLKVYAVETEVGTFDEDVLQSLNLFNGLDSKLRSRAMNDIRLLFLEPFSKVRYPNLNEEDRHDLFVEFIGRFETEVYEFMEKIRERDDVRMQNKEMTLQEIKHLILGDY